MGLGLNFGASGLRRSSLRFWQASFFQRSTEFPRARTFYMMKGDRSFWADEVAVLSTLLGTRIS